MLMAPHGYLMLPGFAPAGEVLFFREKDQKTIDAQSGNIGRDERKLQNGGPTRYAQTRSATRSEGPTMLAGRQAV